MEQAYKIKSIKDFIKNIRCTLSGDEINYIRSKIYKYKRLYDYYTNKKEVNKKPQRKFKK